LSRLTSAATGKSGGRTASWSAVAERSGNAAFGRQTGGRILEGSGAGESGVALRLPPQSKKLRHAEFVLITGSGGNRVRRNELGHRTNHGLRNMRILKAVLMFSILPLLNGCLTMITIHAAKEPTTQPIPDKVFHVEKAVISKNRQLLIFFEGCLTNSTLRNRYTLSISFDQIRNKAETLSLSQTNNGKSYGKLEVSREAIHEGWTPQESLVDNLGIIPVGVPISTPTTYYPEDGSGPWQVSIAYDKRAKLLPNTAQTLYPVVEERLFFPNSWPSQLVFIFVEATSKQEYTIIHVQAVDETVASNWQMGYYCFLPLAIPADIVTSPFQLLYFWGTAGRTK
jgi:hypothetical protein